MTTKLLNPHHSPEIEVKVIDSSLHQTALITQHKRTIIRLCWVIKT